MFIGYFTERPWQPREGVYYGALTDLKLSNGEYDPQIGRTLYNRYIDEKIYAEEMGFDGLMLNEHHSTPFCMGGVVNVEAAILARVTEKAKIVLLGNILPIWDDPLWLAEQLAIIDMISGGRLVTGWVRGGGRESVAHNANPAYNRERFQEAHDFIIKAWTTPGPFRWEGKHFQYRYVNPWCLPLQQPHPPMWIPGIASPETIRWAAQHHYPYIMLATQLEPTKEMFQMYDDYAAEFGFEAGPQHHGYLFKVHLEETEEKAEEVGRKYLSGVSNPFITGNEGRTNQALIDLPGHTSAEGRRRRRQLLGAGAGLEAASRAATVRGSYEEQVKNLSIISGTPTSVLPKIHYILEYLRPGIIFFWDGDGAMTHEDAMRSLKLMGEEVIPAVREMGKELGLVSPYEAPV